MLTPTDLQELRERGVCRVHELLSVATNRAALNWLESVEAADDQVVQTMEPEFEREAVTGRRVLRKLRRLLWNDPAFWVPLIENTGILTLGEQLIGRSAALIFHAAFMKPARIAEGVAFHQDQALWRHEYPGAVSLWIALSPAALENGCVVGYPGSHSRGNIPHRDHRNYEWHASVDPVEEALGQAEPLELGAGSAAIWHRYFVHGSGPNRSGQDRRGMVLVFADASLPGFSARDCYQWSRP